jgi:hypothetical protein
MAIAPPDEDDIFALMKRYLALTHDELIEEGARLSKRDHVRLDDELSLFLGIVVGRLSARLQEEEAPTSTHITWNARGQRLVNGKVRD